MRIVFLTHILDGGAGNHRALNPSLWINKFTEHTAVCYDRTIWNMLGFFDYICDADVIVIHSPIGPLADYAKEIVEKRGDRKIKIVYDVDDYHHDVFLQYQLANWLYDVGGIADSMMSSADGITVASKGLLEYTKTDKPIEYIDNAFDVRMQHNQPQNYTADRFKVVWGGGKSHHRDMEMFARLGVVERLGEKYDIDFYFHKLMPGMNSDRSFGKAKIYSRDMDRCDKYILELYGDADIMIAPLVTEKWDYTQQKLVPDLLNDCRSNLKLVEAGIAGLPCVASNVLGYRQYEGPVTLVNNTTDEWFNAIEALLIDDGKRMDDGEKNNEHVNEWYNAELATKKRIDFYESLGA